MKAIKSRIIRLGLTGNEHAASIATERPSSLTGKLWREAMLDSQLSRLRGTVRVRAQHQIGNGLYDPPSSSIAGWDPPRSSTQRQFPRPAFHRVLEQCLPPPIRVPRVGPPCPTRQSVVAFPSSLDLQVVEFARLVVRFAPPKRRIRTALTRLMRPVT